jgi:hypothetical protein
VAGDAADIVPVVLRPLEITVLYSVLVTTQAAVADVSRRELRWVYDLGRIAAARDVLGSRPMARFAALKRRSPARIQRGFPVRCGFKVRKCLGMTGLADVRADVL